MTAKEVFEYTKESALNRVLDEIFCAARKGEYCATIIKVFALYADEVVVKLKEDGFEVSPYSDLAPYKEFIVRWNQNKE